MKTRRQMPFLLLALLGAGLVWIRPAVSAVIGIPPIISVSGEIVPVKIPRSSPAPVTLRVGFTSRSAETPAVPELTQIAFKIFRPVTLQSAGLPGCSLAKLYSTPAEASHRCSGSLVGHGTVKSEITVPGQAPVQVTGKLLAFYSLPEGQPSILAQITTGEPLLLVYVIPFTISSGQERPYATSLVAREMRIRHGKCLRPCNSRGTYTLHGVYGHISSFEMSLHRIFAHGDKRESLVSANCPAPQHRLQLTFPLLEVDLKYADGVRLTQSVERTCRVAR